MVECKADPKFHRSEDGKSVTQFAVDGVLHYSRFLAAEYNVISIAVSGYNKSSIKISTFYQLKGEASVSEEDSSLLDIYSYISKFKGEAQAKNIEGGEITKTAIDLNKQLNDYSIVEYERCTIISAILLALQDEGFKKSYKSKATSQSLAPTPDRVAHSIVSSIQSVLEDNEIDADRIDAMLGEFKKIQNHPISRSERIKKKKESNLEDNYVLRDITERLEKSIIPLMTLGDKGYDVLGLFYREFIRYAGTDKKTGLVLTPQHITEFFTDIVNLNVNDIVLDTCCGTGGFLIAAMKKLLQLAGNDQSKRKVIKEKQLIGIEKRTDMFTFACANMMMCGDGKSHIYQGDSFLPKEINLIKSLKPNVAFLNPPYDVGEDGQLEFIENALACLTPGGRCAAIIQMSCVTSNKAPTIAARERLLTNHTLKGVFSMPDDLFYPVGVVTCIVVFEAHSPQPSGFKTFFGYFKDDGFIKTKHLGRVDRGQWQSIKQQWLNVYRNHESEASLSMLREVNGKDEWCAEAYIETDYNTLNIQMFAETVKKYIAFRLLNSIPNMEAEMPS